MNRKDTTTTKNDAEDHIEISDYDKYDYDYTTYWKNRSYEHEAEVIALTRLLKNETGKWFIDVGGSFGRHTPLYYKKFEHCILFDYSIKALRQAQKRHKDEGITNVTYVAGNVYHFPFRDNVFDGAMMVRVLHHLHEPQKALIQIENSIRSEGLFILEVANKYHIKSVIRELLRGNFSYFTDHSPKVVEGTKREGSHAKDASIIYNFSLSELCVEFLSRENRVLQKQPVSYLRIPLLKRLFSTPTLVAAERIFQVFLRFFNMTPSVFLKIRVRNKPTVKAKTDTIESVLTCHSCNSKFVKIKKTLICRSCGITYPITDDIYDLRHP